MLLLKNKSLVKSCKPILEEFYKRYKREYIGIFLHQKDIEFREIDLMPLVEAGILKKVRNKFRANVQVFPLSGKFICTDFMLNTHNIRNGKFVRNKDDVWAILAYESPYIAKKAIVENGDVVLDLATGSGIIALFCADKAKKVVATDINPKALHYAKFNAILNNLEDKIEFRLGNMFAPIKNMKFDLIIWNGPTLAVPNIKKKYPIYCFGGADGLNFTRKFIKRAPKYLSKRGKMQWLDPSLGTNTEPESLKIIKQEWKNRKF